MAFLFYEQSNAAQMGIMLLLWPLRKKTQERDLDGTKIVNVVKENSMVRTSLPKSGSASDSCTRSLK